MEGKPSQLSDSQLEELESIGFVWDAHESAWESKFEMLVEFRSERGHCRVPRDFPDNPQLASWIKRQRRLFRSGSVCPSRIARLEELGFVWDPCGICTTTNQRQPGVPAKQC